MSKLDDLRAAADRLQAYQGFSVAARGAPTEDEEEFAADFDAVRDALPGLLVERTKLRAVVEAAKRYHTVVCPCDSCYEDRCDSATCECGCHVELAQAEKALDLALRALEEK